MASLREFFFLQLEQLRERFLGALGELPPEQVMSSCGSGVNACHNIMAMELGGLLGAKLYAGYRFSVPYPTP